MWQDLLRPERLGHEIGHGAVQRFERKAWNRLIDYLINLPPLSDD
jgi:hypothetical protein